MSRSSFSKVFPVSKMTQETLSIESFPSEVQSTLSEAFDKDGNGIIDCQELVDAANLYTQTKATNSLLRKGVCFAAALSVCLVGAIAGLTYGIVDANKDTRVDGRVLVTKQQEPISVSTNEIQLSLATLAFVPFEVTSKVTDVAFASESPEKKVYFRKILSIDVIPEEGLELETTAGDLITWDIDTSAVITVTLKDGTSWAKNVACTQCTATNVYSTSEVIEGVKNFEEATGLSGRRLLRYVEIKHGRICQLAFLGQVVTRSGGHGA
eukprot:248967_1